MNYSPFIESFMNGVYEEAWGDFETHCTECSFLRETKDMYATGDSPTGYSCEVPCTERCPHVRSALDQLVADIYPGRRAVIKFA